MTCSYDGAPNLGVAAHRRGARRECPGRLEATPRTVGTSTPGKDRRSTGGGLGRSRFKQVDDVVQGYVRHG